MTADVNGGTEYVVLLESTEANEKRYELVSRYTARDAAGAIKAAASVIHPQNGSFVAVAIPARSWSLVKVTPKVETTLILEEAK